MKIKLPLILLSCLILINIACSARFVKKANLKNLHNKYSGIYIIKQAVDIGNNRTAQVGQKVKLYFLSNSSSIKTYAYPHTEPRETSIGNNILYLFKDDFSKEQWDENAFEKKLFEIITLSPNH